MVFSEDEKNPFHDHTKDVVDFSSGKFIEYLFNLS